MPIRPSSVFSRSKLPRASARLLLASLLLQAGCYEAIYKAVVDDPDHKAGGSVVATLSGMVVGSTPALAQQNPMVIDGGNVKLIVNITAGDDVEGHDAHTVLGVAGGTISLPITETSRSSVTLSYGGTQCNATAGVIDLTADMDLKLSGTFDATGYLTSTSAPCQLNGKLTGVPQVVAKK